MKIKFRNIKLSKDNQSRLVTINNIIEEYSQKGFVLTLRQLYYQLVSRNIIPNKLPEYAKLSTLLKEGRMAGIVDWNAIEDRLRIPSKPSSWDSPKDIMDTVINQYEKPRMKGQVNYVEVWVEKDALSGVLKRVTEKYHIPIMVNRGYSSVTAMYDAYNRFIKAVKLKQTITIIYLGDYDPSGIDMIRDIRDRISEFLTASRDIQRLFHDLDDEQQSEYIRPYYIDQGLDTSEAIEFAEEDFAKEYTEKNFKVIPVALTIEQIRQYNPPPNPAKLKDPRSKEFIKQKGRQSWEVDALKPEVLNQILTDSILKLIDVSMYNKIVKEEKGDIDKLKKLKDKL